MKQYLGGVLTRELHFEELVFLKHSPPPPSQPLSAIWSEAIISTLGGRGPPYQWPVLQPKGHEGERDRRSV